MNLFKIKRSFAGFVPELGLASVGTSFIVLLLFDAPHFYDLV